LVKSADNFTEQGEVSIYSGGKKYSVKPPAFYKFMIDEKIKNLMSERPEHAAGLFLFSETLDGNLTFWQDILEIHDTHGLPFDIIFIKLKEEDLIFEEMKFELFKEIMLLLRKRNKEENK
jgi:hypothetical protein